MSSEIEPIYAYMCSIDFDCELTHGNKDAIVCTTLDRLKHKKSCVDNTKKHHCGIYKVKIEFVEEIQPESEF